MFTGIIQHRGELLKRKVLAKGLQLVIKTQFNTIEPGESIAVNGICLTAIESSSEGIVTVEVSPETQRVTTVDSWECGCLVNIERAMTANQYFGGHFVLGHVDTTATVASIEQQADFHVLTLSGLHSECKAYLIDKGCVTVDGISLTINSESEGAIRLMIIPHTLKNTNLEKLNKNDSVNIEFDYVAKVVAKQTNLYQPSVAEV